MKDFLLHVEKDFYYSIIFGLLLIGYGLRGYFREEITIWMWKSPRIREYVTGKRAKIWGLIYIATGILVILIYITFASQFFTNWYLL